DAWVKQHGPAGHEKPALTSGARLPARWVIHAVGPVWGSGDDDRKLQAAYTSALQLAHDKQFASIAFPSISTGIFGFPVERGAAIGVQAAVDFCAAHPDSPFCPATSAPSHSLSSSVLRLLQEMVDHSAAYHTLPAHWILTSVIMN